MSTHTRICVNGEARVASFVFLLLVVMSACGCEQKSSQVPQTLPTVSNRDMAFPQQSSALQTSELAPQSVLPPIPRPEEMPVIADDVLVQLVEMKAKVAQKPNGFYTVDVRNNPMFTDDSIDLLLKCPNIDDLTLERVMITDEGLEKLKNLNLNRLILNGSPVTADGIEMLSNQPMANSLFSLGLKDIPVSDEHLGMFRKFKHLQRLDLTGSLITDASIPALQPLRLIRLNVTNSKLSPEGLEQLKSKMPATEVVRS